MADQILTFSDGTQLTTQEFEALDAAEQDALRSKLVSSTTGPPPDTAPNTPGESADQSVPLETITVGVQGEQVDKAFFNSLTPVQQEFLKKQGIAFFNMREQQNARRREEFQKRIEEAGGIRDGLLSGDITVDDAVLAGFERGSIERFADQVQAQQEIADLGGVQVAVASGQASDDLLKTAGFSDEQLRTLREQISALSDDARDVLVNDGLDAFNQLVADQMSARERLTALGGIQRAIAFDAISDDELVLAGFDPDDVQMLRDQVDRLPDDLREILATEGVQALNRAISAKKVLARGPESAANLLDQPSGPGAPGIANIGPAVDAEGRPLVQVADGFVLESDFQDLSESEQRFLRDQGVDAFNQRTEEFDLPGPESTINDVVDDRGRVLVAVKDGFVLADEFFKLSTSDKKLLRDVGVEDFNRTRERQVQISQTLAQRGQLGQEDTLQQAVRAQEGTAEVNVARAEANIEQARARLTIESFRDPMHALANGIPIATFGLAGFNTDEIREAQRVIDQDLTPGQRRLLRDDGYDRLEALFALEFLEGVGDPPPPPEPAATTERGPVQAPFTTGGRTLLLTISPTPTPTDEPATAGDAGGRLPFSDQAEAVAGVVARSLERSGEAAIMETEGSIAIGSALAEDIRRLTGLVAVDVPKPVRDVGAATGGFLASGIEATGESAMLEAQGLRAIGEGMAQTGSALGESFGQMLVDVGRFLRDGQRANGIPTPEELPLPPIVEALVPLQNPGGDVGGYAVVLEPTPTPAAPESSGAPGTPFTRRVLIVLEDGADSVIDVGQFIIDQIAHEEDIYKDDPFRPTKLPKPPIPTATPTPVPTSGSGLDNKPILAGAALPVFGLLAADPIPGDEIVWAVIWSAFAAVAAGTVVQNRDEISELVSDIPDILKGINLPGPTRPEVTPGPTTSFPKAADLPNSTEFPGTAPEMPNSTEFPWTAPQLPDITDLPGSPPAEVQKLMGSALEYIGAYSAAQAEIADTDGLSPRVRREIEQAILNGDEEFEQRWREQSLADTRAMAERAAQGVPFGQTTDPTPEVTTEDSTDSVADFVARGFERQVEARAAAAERAVEPFVAEPKAEDYIRKVRRAMDNLAARQAVLAEARRSFVQSGGAAPTPTPEANSALVSAISAAEAVLASGATAVQASNVVSEILATSPQLPQIETKPPSMARPQGTPVAPTPATTNAAATTQPTPTSDESEAPATGNTHAAVQAGPADAPTEVSVSETAAAQTPTTVEQAAQSPTAINQAVQAPTTIPEQTAQPVAAPSPQSIPVTPAQPIMTSQPSDSSSPSISELPSPSLGPVAELADIPLSEPATAPAVKAASAARIGELSSVSAKSQVQTRARPATRTAVRSASLFGDEDTVQRGSKRRARQLPGRKFPHRVAWRQGFGFRELNLDTGESKFTLRPPPGVKVATGPGSASRSYTVLEFDDDPPSQRDLDMGAMKATAGQGLGFSRKPRKFGRRGRKGRKSRRRRR